MRIESCAVCFVFLIDLFPFQTQLVRIKIMDDNVDFDSLSGSTEDSIVTFEDPTEADENQMAIDVPDNCANSMTSTEFVQSIPSLTKHHGDITWEDYQNGVDMQVVQPKFT